MKLSALPSVFLLTCLLVPSLSSAQTVYRWVDRNGVTHFGDSSTAPNQARPVPLHIAPERRVIKDDEVPVILPQEERTQEDVVAQGIPNSLLSAEEQQQSVYLQMRQQCDRAQNALSIIAEADYPNNDDYVRDRTRAEARVERLCAGISQEA